MSAVAGAGYAVLACPHCGQPVPVEARHASSSCPGCRARFGHARARSVWAGSDPREAQRVVADLRLRASGGPAVLPVAPLPRHDDPLDAVAAKARPVANKSQRAEAVALWATRLVGDVAHGELLDALQRAGLERQRAKLEIVRMLACDVLLEPKPGRYRLIDA